MFEKIIIVTRNTRLQELVARFNTREQAKFYIEHSGGNFEDYKHEDEIYKRSVETLRSQLDFGLRVQIVDRQYLPSLLFLERDLVVAIGQDGLVANTAKYVGTRPLIGVNPDPLRYDGILVPVRVDQAREVVQSVIAGQAAIKNVTLAEAVLNDGQRLLAFNDLFIGARSHVSARYRIEFERRSENHSSSGIIVSTGAGSTGWLSSIFNMVSSISQFTGGPPTIPIKQTWDSPNLMFVVREPFVSKHSNADIAAGILHDGQTLMLESQMPTDGVIFSDGIECDYLAFNSGSLACIRAAKETAQLVLPKRLSHRHASNQIQAKLTKVHS